MRELLGAVRQQYRDAAATYELLSYGSKRRLAGMVSVTGFVGAGVTLLQLVPLAAAQAGGGADDIMCGTGAGEAATLLFGVLAAVLLIIAGYRGAMGMNNMGSSRSDKKREGEEQLKGAGFSLIGVFVMVAFPAILDQVGVSTFSCVEFAPF